MNTVYKKEEGTWPGIWKQIFHQFWDRPFMPNHNIFRGLRGIANRGLGEMIASVYRCQTADIFYLAMYKDSERPTHVLADFQPGRYVYMII